VKVRVDRILELHVCVVPGSGLVNSTTLNGVRSFACGGEDG